MKSWEAIRAGLMMAGLAAVLGLGALDARLYIIAHAVRGNFLR